MHEEGLKSRTGQAPAKTVGLLRHPRVRLGAVVVLAVAAGVVAWALVGKDSSNSPSNPNPTPNVSPIAPIGLSAQGLRTLAGSVKQPIYWAGPKPGYLYELTRTRTGNVFIRYLPPGVKVGAKGADYLIVGTYPFVNALQALQSVENGKGFALPRGGLAVVDEKYPKSVHLAYPGIDYQVEVYDPSPALAKEIALSPAVRKVG